MGTPTAAASPIPFPRRLELLRANPAVSHVSDEGRITYTREFRDDVVRRYMRGERPVTIFRSWGLDPKLVGHKRIERCIARWKENPAAASAVGAGEARLPDRLTGLEEGVDPTPRELMRATAEASVELALRAAGHPDRTGRPLDSTEGLIETIARQAATITRLRDDNARLHDDNMRLERMLDDARRPRVDMARSGS